MRKREKPGLQLCRVQRDLSRWRSQHGGRGRPIPAELWSAAVDVASVEGVEATARALGVDRARLSRRIAGRPGSADPAAQTSLSATGFVEVDPRQVLAGGGQVLVRLTGRDGEQVEFAFDAGAVDVAAVAGAFWGRAR